MQWALRYWHRLLWCWLLVCGLVSFRGSREHNKGEVHLYYGDELVVTLQAGTLFGYESIPMCDQPTRLVSAKTASAGVQLLVIGPEALNVQNLHDVDTFAVTDDITSIGSPPVSMSPLVEGFALVDSRE